MNMEKVAAMAERVAQAADSENHEAALANVDEAVDNIIAAIKVLDENLPKVKVENVPQRAARDVIQETLDAAIKPYTADIVKALEIFGG